MWGLLSGTRRGSDFSLKTKIRLITILKITGAVPKKVLTVPRKRNARWELWSILARSAPVPHPQKIKNTHIRRIQEVSHFAKEHTMSLLSASPAELPSWAPGQEIQCWEKLPGTQKGRNTGALLEEHHPPGMKRGGFDHMHLTSPLSSQSSFWSTIFFSPTPNISRGAGKPELFLGDGTSRLCSSWLGPFENGKVG